ncbi:U6 snRNA-associated Sm-like protein LSm6 [Silurus asotus]|uniref:U6 snRNA-associated Sm-like protein LSm6 n=1 Tax=Silurus asotus TaxID=30991 RepID=A0AAD5B0G0_SILAS|nr:U6 snRNA-associated Sm-like protein LSm6 [Silurus asotus]
MSVRKQTPSDFLKQIIGRPVVVKLNSGVDYRGVLACLDGYMNIAVEQTEEYVNGQLKNKYGDAFLRGNNAISPLHRITLNANLTAIEHDAEHRWHAPKMLMELPEHFVSLRVTVDCVRRQKPC